jgi:aspartate/glutamate racemase
LLCAALVEDHIPAKKYLKELLNENIRHYWRRKLVIYCRLLQNSNESINQKRGGIDFAECIIHCFNFYDIIKNNNNNGWESTFKILAKACENLKKSSAEAILLCANTLHFLADRLKKQIGLPIIHIATETATEIKKRNY